MRYRFAAGFVALGMAGLGSTMVVGAANADPTSGGTFPLVCNNGNTYSAVSNGNGEFTPALDLGGTSAFVPVSFGTFTGTVRDAQGNVVDSFTEEGSAKGQSAKGLKNPVTCTYSFSEVSDGSDPEFPAGYTFSGSGTAVVRITPSN